MRMTRSLLLVALAALPLAQAGAQRARDRGASFRMDTTFAFAARGAADLTVPNGDVTVTTWDRDQVRVVVVSDDVSYELRASESRFSLVPDERENAGARVEVTVPASTRVSVNSHSGDVRVSGLAADLSVRAQGGDIMLRDITGRVDLSMLSGDVSLTRIRGDVEVNGVSGDIDLSVVTGQLDVTTVSGAVTARDITSNWVRLRTTSGDLAYDGTIAAGGSYELVAHSGDVSITLPANPSARVTISTFNGEIDSEFPITLAPGDHAIGAGRSKRFSFDLGRGEARVSLQSFNGDITLRGRGASRSSR